MTQFNKESSRYPYTYAYDWIRFAGLAESRSDAAAWVSRRAAEMNVDKMVLVEQYANDYLGYYSELEKLNNLRDAKVAKLWEGVTCRDSS